MKKIVLSIMMVVALVAGGTAMAQTKTDGNTGATAQKECCKEGKGEKCDKKGKKGDKAKKDKKGQKGEKGNRPKFNPFDGVQLTNDQQQKLQVLRQGLGPVVLTPEQQTKIKENPNLTPQEKAQLKAERKNKKMEAKKNYLKGVKEILTPEQYVIFLENVYLYSPQSKSGMKVGKDVKKNGKDFKGNKGNKAKKNKESAK